jgi:xanthine/uracil permease
LCHVWDDRCGRSSIDLGDSLKWFSDIVNTLGSTGMAVGAFIALILDNTVPGTDEERGLKTWSRR